MKKIFLFISIILLIILLWFSEPSKFINTILKADLYYVLFGIIITLVNIFIRSAKWAVLINKDIISIAPIQLLGSVIGNFTPAKIGDPIKALILKLKKGTPVSIGLSTIVWERVLDLLVLVLFSLLVISISMSFITIFSILVFVFLLLLLVLIQTKKSFGFKVYRFLKKLPFTNKLDKKFVDRFYERKISKRAFVFSFILTLLCWFLDSVVYYFSFLSVGIKLNLILITGLMALSIIIGISSSLPGGLGSFEFALAILLTQFNISFHHAVAGVMMARMLTFWLTGLISIPIFISLMKHKSQFKKIFN